MSNDMGPQQVISWDSDDDIPEVFLHGRVPSLAQLVEPELNLKLQGTDYVCQPGPYSINSATWESHARPAARAAAKPPTAVMDNDVPELIMSEDYLPTLTVEPAVWDSLDERSRHLWGLEAIIVKSLEDPDIDSNGKHKSALMVPLVLEVQQQHMNLTAVVTGRMARNIRFADDEVTSCAPAPND